MTTVPLLQGFNGSNYQVTRSLRFRASATPYLNRTFGIGNQQKWTWSGWVKRGALGAINYFLEGYPATAGNTNDRTQFYFTASDTFEYSTITLGSVTEQVTTTQVFRDPSAWYHIVVALDTTQATASNRLKIYINGSQVTAFSTATYPALNASPYINSAKAHYIGAAYNGSLIASTYIDGYLAEMNFVDGQQLTPSSFGYPDLYGVWQPKRYNGTYGTNGFYLPFRNTTSTTTLVADSSGNGNNWTPNNISLTAGTTYDSMIDSPTNYADGGTGRGNYAVLNPLGINGFVGTISNANLTWTSAQNAAGYAAASTFPATTGGTSKWYCEITMGTRTSTYHTVGLSTTTNGWTSPVYIVYRSDGLITNNGTTVGTFATFNSGDVVSMAYDNSTGVIGFYKNNVFQASTTASSSYTWYFVVAGDSTVGTAIYNANFGQQPFVYTPPSGYLALNTQNLPPSAVPYGAPYMNAITYTGYGPLVPSGLGILTKRNASTQNVSKSLRFRASASAYLNRTPSIASNQRTWTWSAWIKRGTIGTNQVLFGAGTNGTSTNLVRVGFLSDALQLYVDTGTANYSIISTAVYRDPSAWYHIIAVLDTTQATASNRMFLYVNGVQVTSLSTANYTPQNNTYGVNSTLSHNIGRYVFDNTQLFDGYLAEVNFIDGQALTPSSFGQTNSDGVWVPKAYTGTYGTNGFYLPFTNTTSTTTLVADSSGNGNNWTPNNISLTAGTTYDSMIDSPTDYASAGDYATLNPLTAPANVTIADANLSWAQTTASANRSSMATFGMSSGKWYWEFNVGSSIGANNSAYPGIAQATFAASLTNYCGGTSDSWAYTSGSGNKVNNGSGSAYGATYTSNDVIGFAFDADAGSLTCYKNGVSQGVAFTGLTSGPYFPVVSESIGAGGTTSLKRFMNFGQQPFVYAAPSGYTGLNTFSLTAPSTTWFSSANNSGNASATAYPDFVWVKSRSSAQNHSLNDTLRGPTLNLVSNSTAAEAGASTMFAVNKYGLTLGNDASVNSSSFTDVMWGWQGGNGVTSTNTNGTITSTVSASTTSGVSIVTYTGTGSVATVGHGLSVAPNLIIWKNRSSVQNWVAYHSSLGATGNVYLNLTNGFSADSTTQNNTAPTSSVFTVATSGAVNGSTNSIVAYCFAAIRGFSAFGSYTGNGSADGPFIYTGFRPRWFLVKISSGGTGAWHLIDTSCSPYNQVGVALFPNTSQAEAADFNSDILSNGLKIRNTQAEINGSGFTYIYAAFAENPFNMSRAR